MAAQSCTFLSDANTACMSLAGFWGVRKSPGGKADNRPSTTSVEQHQSKVLAMFL